MKTLIAIGDSITHGSYVNIPETNRDEDWRVASPTFSEIIKEKLSFDKLINYGADGITVSASGFEGNDYSLTKYIDEMEGGDTVIIAGGTNDYGNEKTVELGNINDKQDVSFFGGLFVLFTKVKEKYNNSKIYVLTPIHRLSEDEKNSKGYILEDYRKAIIERAKEFGFEVIDGKCVPINPKNKEDKEKYMIDGLHPNQEGHKIMAEYLLRYIEA